LKPHPVPADGHPAGEHVVLGHRHQHPMLARVLRVFIAAVVLLAGWMLIRLLRGVDWGEVAATLAAYPWTTLAAAAGLVVASYLLYGAYDLLGRRYTHHEVGTLTVAAIAFVAYASNLNLGPIVGAVGSRLRLYTRYGVRAAQVARIMLLSFVTNWSGYLLLAGFVLAARWVELPDALAVGAGALQVIGVLMMALPITYLLACARARRREWHVRGHHFKLPHAGMALLQVAVSSANWALIAGVVWTLLPPGVPYGVVLATYLSAAVIALVTHIPGGLGVVEGVFLFALAARVPAHELLAALLAFRAMYYLLPLAVAGGLFLLLEARAKKR
jgi:uncharacterized membrane protein YbhN (UPF0104 family)